MFIKKNDFKLNKKVKVLKKGIYIYIYVCIFFDKRHKNNFSTWK